MQEKNMKNESKSSKMPPVMMNESKPPCECNVRNVLKEFVKYLRHYGGSMNVLKDKIKQQLEGQAPICSHTLEDDITENTKILMMGWFENFTEELQSNEKRNKVKKPHVFRRFVKALQTDFEPELTEL